MNLRALCTTCLGIRALSSTARLRGQVKWIDRNTMPAKPRTQIKRRELERLHLCCFDYFPDINTHRAVNELQLIDQCDIKTTKDVQLCDGRLFKLVDAPLAVI